MTRRSRAARRSLARRPILRAWFACWEGCAYCPGPIESVDHVVPLSLGGRDGVVNLVPACRACNSLKSSADWSDRPEFCERFAAAFAEAERKGLVVPEIPERALQKKKPRVQSMDAVFDRMRAADAIIFWDPARSRPGATSSAR